MKLNCIDITSLIKILDDCINKNVSFILKIKNQSYKIKIVNLKKHLHIFKIQGMTHNFDLLPILSKTMLGPNTNFINIKLIPIINNHHKIIIDVNLISIIQQAQIIKLNFVIKSINN